jgi:hypothetical protein
MFGQFRSLSLGALRVSFGLCFVLFGTGLLSGCQNYSGQLLRAQSYYQESHYTQALAVFRHLEPDIMSLGPRDRTRYYYLRGMTDLRLGYPDHARYWLSLSRATLTQEGSALTPEEESRLKESLAELNKEHYALVRSGGVPALEAKRTCEWSTDCDEGFVCKDHRCLSL